MATTHLQTLLTLYLTRQCFGLVQLFSPPFSFCSILIYLMSDIHAPLISQRRSREEEEEEEDDYNQQDRFQEPDRRTTDYGSGVYHYPPHLQPGHFTSLEKLFFFLCSLLLILLFIFVGLYARSSQKDDDDPASRLPLPPKIPKNHTKNQVRKWIMRLYVIVYLFVFLCVSLIVWTIVVSSQQRIYYRQVALVWCVCCCC